VATASAPAAPVDARPELVLEPFSVDGSDPELVARAAALEEAVRALLASSPDLRLLETPVSQGARRFGTRSVPGGAKDQISVYSLAGSPVETAPISLSDPASAAQIASWIAEQSGVSPATIAQANPDALAAFVQALEAKRSPVPGSSARATAAIKRALAADPDFLPAARVAMTMLANAGDRQGATAAAESVVRLDPRDDATRRLLFDWSRESGDLAAAIRHGAALEGGSDPEVLTFLARQALGAGDTDTFTRLLGRLQKTAARPLPLHAADATAARGQLGVAVQQYYQLEPAERDNPHLSLKIGRIDVLRHSIPAAELELEKLRVLDASYGAELLQAYLAAEKRDARGAADALARAGAARNRGADFHTASAEVHAILSDHRGVVRSLSAAVDSREPTFAYILANPLFAYLKEESEFAPLQARIAAAQQEVRASLASVR
jgi:hypothetical protein